MSGLEAAPGGNYTSDEEPLRYIKSRGVSAIHHASLTNKMGRANDTMAVVDSRARVFGVRRLRIIDSSSFIFTPPAHTQGATCKRQIFGEKNEANAGVDARAEKLVDDIEKDF